MEKPNCTRPAGFHSVTPSLIVKGADDAIKFYIAAFGAVERYRMAMPNGTIMHAEITIGDSIIMLSDEFPDWGAVSPLTSGGTPSALMIYTSDCDTMFANAIAAGATELRPLMDQFYGDRSGQLLDPFGYKWTISTRIEEVEPAEIQLRAAAWATPSE